MKYAEETILTARSIVSVQRVRDEKRGMEGDIRIRTSVLAAMLDVIEIAQQTLDSLQFNPETEIRDMKFPALEEAITKLDEMGWNDHS